MKTVSFLCTKGNRSTLLQLPPPLPPPSPLAGGPVHYFEQGCRRNSHVNRPLALNRAREEK